MPPIERRGLAGFLELLAVTVGLAALTIGHTYPLAFNLSTLGYRLHVMGDHQYSVWNVAWVSHALLTDPLNVFNANIFYPHRGTLGYSEANLAAGALGLPAYWLTRDAFATHNFVLLVSFVLSGTGMYYLVRYLTADRRAAAVSAIGFAFCPYVFGHLPHIQLLMTAGIPFSLLAFHRLADRPTIGRGVALGAAMGAQALACAYYAVFVAFVIGLAVLLTAATSAGRNRRYWLAVGSGALVAAAVVGPLFLPYVLLDRGGDFARTVDESRQFSATWLDYITASAYSAAWLTPNGWKDVLFPGFIPTLFSVAGVYWAWRSGGRQRILAVLYLAIGGLAFWFSLGPAAGLYSLAHDVVPGFNFLRAPSRFGMLVTFALCALAGLGLAVFIKRRPMPGIVAAALIVIAVAERAVPVPITPNPGIQPVYHFLATQPRGALLEMPPLSNKFAFTRTRYMLASTVHWMPLVNAYSDFSPKSFDDNLNTLAQFPNRDSLTILRKDNVRYVIFHVDDYLREGVLPELETSLAEFAPALRLLYQDERSRLYEIIGDAPPEPPTY